MSATERELRVMVVSVETSWLTPERSCCSICAGLADKCLRCGACPSRQIESKASFLPGCPCCPDFSTCSTSSRCRPIPREAVRAQEMAKCEGIKKK